MEVCDRVSGDANGAQQSVQAMIKRLAHRNANVQLYTLEVSLASLAGKLAFQVAWCSCGMVLVVVVTMVIGS